MLVIRVCLLRGVGWLVGNCVLVIGGWLLCIAYSVVYFGLVISIG